MPSAQENTRLFFTRFVLNSAAPPPRTGVNTRRTLARIFFKAGKYLLAQPPTRFLISPP